MEKQKRLNLGPKMSYFGILTKDALFRHFWARILKLLLLYLKSALSNLSNI